jgi:hypothetical protein
VLLVVVVVVELEDAEVAAIELFVRLNREEFVAAVPEEEKEVVAVVVVAESVEKEESLVERFHLFNIEIVLFVLLFVL